MNKETLPQIGVSETLRMARERTGQDLRYVADMLRIRYAYLEAIENGEYQNLPGAPYAIGFVRAYADHLNLNSVEIVERFKRERADLDQQTQLVFPKPLPEGKVPSGGILLVAVILGVFVYGAWFFLSGQDKPIVELIPEIPARLMALVGAGEEDPAEPADAGPSGAETADVDAEPGETMVDAERDAETPPADAEAGAGEAEATPEIAATAPDEGAGEPSEPAEPVATAETTPEPAVPAEPAPVAEEPATADVSAPEAEEPAASMQEQATEPLAETDAEPADVAGASAVEPEAEETADAGAATAPEDAGQEQGTAAQSEVVTEPEPVRTTPETDVAVTPEPSPSDEPAQAADEQSAAAVAQRVLEELSQSPDEPADADAPAAPTAAAEADDEAPASPGTRMNGDPVASGARSDGTAEEVPVAAIAPAARTPETAEPADAPATAPGNGTGPATPSIMAARPAGKVYGEENEEYRIVITARVDSWVEVSTQQGELLLTRVLRAGDSFRVPDRTGLSLVTGNAGGLAISVDGNQVPDLGPVGAVRRGVELDPDRLIAGTAGNL